MNVLFIGIGNSPVAWYRCGLPANALNYDWVGTVGNPDNLLTLSGNLEDVPDFDKYDVIVVQQVAGPGWLQQIKDWQAKGIKVVYEIDDFIHGIHKIEHHSFRKQYAKAVIKKFYVPCFEACDAMICSTQFLSDQYSKYNPNQYVCLVGLDTKRYNVEFPSRDAVVIGWAGGTGHHHSVGPWLEEVSKIVGVYENAYFVSIGTRYADPINARYPGKGLCIPWTTIENYPYALTNIDIALAPAHDSKYYQSKSDLRWLEASAVGVPTVANPLIYHDIEEESTGMLASTPSEAGDAIMELVDNKDLRLSIGKQAKEYVNEKRTIKVASEQWQKSLTKILEL